MNNKTNFDRYARDYNQLLKERTNFFSSSEEYFARYKVDILRKNVKFSVSRLLEFGCGIGRNIPYLRKAFPEATIMGSDISSDSIEIAKRDNIGIEFICEDEGVPLAQKFDLIFIAGVFHHIPEEKRLNIAKMLYDRMTSGALLFIFEHNPYNPMTRHIVANCAYDEDADLIKASGLKRILRKASFIIEREEYCLFIPPKISFLVRVENMLGWLPLGGQYWIQARCAK
jgi:SAM-dependent methyltransferase